MFLKMCKYLGVTPGEFFDMKNTYPAELLQLIELLKTLNGTQLDHITAIVADLAKANTSVR